MRIAYVTETYPPEINGVALTVARAVGHLRARGHPLLLCRPAQAGELRGAAPGEWRSAGLPIPMYPELRCGFAWPKTLVERFRAFRAELVHVATEGPLGWAAVVAARRLGLPVTSDFRTNFHHYSRHYRLAWIAPWVRGYLRRFHNRTRRTFAPTAETCRQLRADGFERVEQVGRASTWHASIRRAEAWRCAPAGAPATRRCCSTSAASPPRRTSSWRCAPSPRCGRGGPTHAW